MPSLLKRMTSFENELTILRFSKCFDLCRYIRIVKVQAHMRISIRRIHFIHKLFEKYNSVAKTDAYYIIR